MGSDQFTSIVESIKSKVMKTLKRKGKKKKKEPSTYMKMGKTASVRVEIRSRKAQHLIDKTIKAADRPGKAFVS